jgi:hypothetical protein
MQWLRLIAVAVADFALPAACASLRDVIASRKSNASLSGRGVQAERIADLVELFGVNTFSSMDQDNV